MTLGRPAQTVTDPSGDNGCHRLHQQHTRGSDAVCRLRESDANQCDYFFFVFLQNSAKIQIAKQKKSDPNNSPQVNATINAVTSTRL